MRLLILTVLLALLTACAGTSTRLDDGYQAGDLSGTIVDLQTRYCATADPRQRALLLAALDAAQLPIPDRGACTDLLTLVGEQRLEALDAVDVEAAERDREAALRRLEAMEE